MLVVRCITSIFSLMTKRQESSIVVEKIRSRYGNSIDLSEFKYVDNSTACTFICGKCGNKWDSLPFVVVRGKGCPRCDAMKVISRSKEKFGDKFSYVKTLDSYCGMKENCCFHCNIHDVDFNVEPLTHLTSKNGGCKKCASEDCSKRKTKTLAEFINGCKSKFGDKFDFSKTTYTSNMADVIITCKRHGDFITTPKKFLSSEFGCEKCSRDARRVISKIWLERFKRIHGDLYDYSKSSFGKVDDKIEIVCKEHGSFYQTPHNHANGEGCPICGAKLSKLEKLVSDALERNSIEYEAQKRFAWLGRMSMDFYLPLSRIAIECQGEQHYEPIEFFGGYSQFGIQVKRDKLKYDLAIEHGIRVVYYCDKKFAKCDDGNDKLFFTEVGDLIRYINSLDDIALYNGEKDKSKE